MPQAISKCTGSVEIKISIQEARTLHELIGDHPDTRNWKFSLVVQRP